MSFDIAKPADTQEPEPRVGSRAEPRVNSAVETINVTETAPSVLELATWFKRNEVPRKLLHGSIAFFSTALYLVGVQTSQVWPVLVSALVPIAILEFLRFKSPKINRLYVAAVGSLMRESEKTGNHVNGVIWYLLGLSIVLSIFPKDISFLSIYLLSWSDLAASTVGRAYGYLTPRIIGNKSLAGSLAAFVTGVLSTLFIYHVLLPVRTEYNPPSLIMYNFHLSKMPTSALALIMGVTASISELFPIIDDNLSIPIICACVQWLVVRFTTLPYSYGVLA